MFLEAVPYLPQPIKSKFEWLNSWTRYKYDTKKLKYNTKNNINMTQIGEYVKIIWIKKNTCQNLYNILNLIWYEKKYEHDTNTR